MFCLRLVMQSATILLSKKMLLIFHIHNSGCLFNVTQVLRLSSLESV